MMTGRRWRLRLRLPLRRRAGRRGAQLRPRPDPRVRACAHAIRASAHVRFTEHTRIKYVPNPTPGRRAMSATRRTITIVRQRSSGYRDGPTTPAAPTGRTSSPCSGGSPRDLGGSARRVDNGPGGTQRGAAWLAFPRPLRGLRGCLSAGQAFSHFEINRYLRTGVAHLHAPSPLVACQRGCAR